MAEITLQEYITRLNEAGQHKTLRAAQKKAREDGFNTARKVGRTWVIDENEPYLDNRCKHPIEEDVNPQK